MKVEQACRFRLDEGYCVFAKSPGIQPEQESVLGDIFNSNMNAIFPSIGSSILSCAVSGEDAYLARNTLRTDIHGRKTIFTHSYVISLENYARVMAQAPMTILGIDMQSLLDNQAPGVQASEVELPPLAESQPIEALFEKYNLTQARFSRLLIGAYLAIAGRGSLQLVTSLPLSETATMVRELTRCILEGLMPYMKGKVSFSSGNDPRMAISVISTAYTQEPSGDLLFGVEDDSYTDIQAPDELTQMTFDALAALSFQERKESLVKMQAWLERTTDLRKAVALPLICAAYCISNRIELNNMVLLMLFRCIGSDQNIATEVSDKLLTNLIDRLHQGGEILPEGIYMLADYYLGANSSEAYRQICDQVLAVSPVEVCINLAEAIIEQPIHDRIRQMLRTLMRRIPTDDPGISSELRTNLILWILRENDQEFIDYATVLLLNCPASQHERLALGILQATCDENLLAGEEAVQPARPLTKTQDAILAKALSTIAAKQLDLPKPYIDVLDQHMPTYSATLRQGALDFLFAVRLAKLDAETGLQLAVRLANIDSGFGHEIVEGLKAGRNPGIWELYNARSCQWGDMDFRKVASVLQNYNTFNHPCGPFEMAAVTRWIALIESDFSDEGEDAKFSTYNKRAKWWLDATDQLTLSPDAQVMITHRIAEIFWKYIQMDMVYLNTQGLYDERLWDDITIDPIKMTLTGICIELHGEPKNSKYLIDELMNPEIQPEIRAALVDCAEKLVFIFLNRYKFLSWDLVLCSCWKFGEKENGPDMKQFLEFCEKLDTFFEKQKAKPVIEIQASILLADGQLCKTISKLSSNSNVFQKLTEVIKPESTGFFSFLKGNKKDTREENRHGGKPDRRGGYYDPNAEYDANDRRKGKNKK